MEGWARERCSGTRRAAEAAGAARLRERGCKGILIHELFFGTLRYHAQQAALKKTNNDDFAALLILTSPQEAEPDNKTDLSSDDSNEAKQQRLLDYFRDLGDQYWGWQV